MAGFFDQPDPTNPFVPSSAQTLFSALTNLGAGISAASARNLPAYYGIAPGAQAFSNAYGNLLTRGANYDLASKRYALEKENADVTKQYREAQIADLKRQADIDAALMKGLPGVLGGSGGNSGATPGFRPPQGPQMGPNFSEGIAGIESGGNYGAVGPVATPQGNRAYGKYQVLDSNIGPWTQEVLGKAMTPQEFLANPQAQDQVFNAKFGQYVQKYGPEGAARAWFAGEGGMNNPNASDVNGTTVAGYGQRFAQASGMPQLPGPPPTNTDLLPYMVSKRFAPFANFAASQRQRQYEDAWKRYQAGMSQAEFNQKVHNGEVIQLPDGSWGPNPAFVAAEAAKAKAAGTDADSQMTLVDYKAVSKQNTDLQNSGMKARSRIADLQRLEQLGKDLDTGWGAEAIANFKAMAKGAGLDIASFGLKDNVGQAQAFRALANQFALQQRDTSQGTGMPGAMSDNDLRILQSMIPSLSMTAEGRAYLTTTMKRIAQRQIAMAKVASDFMRSPDAHKQPNALYDKLSAYADAHPIWSEDDLKKAETLQKADRPPLDSFQPKVQPNGFATNPNPNAPTNMPRPSLDSFGR